MSNDLTTIPTREAVGPAMSVLSDKQQRFVIHYFDTGGRSPQAAAKMAGYEGGDHACAQRGYELVRNPKVIAAMREEADKRFAAGVVGATIALEALVKNPEHKDHYKAITRTLDQAGMQIETRHRTIVEDTRNEDEVKARIIRLAAEIGIDPVTFAAKRGVVIDAEFAEVTPDNRRIEAPHAKVDTKVSETDTMREQEIDFLNAVIPNE